MALISSSVTLLSVDCLILNILKMRFVTLVNNQTIGNVRRLKKYIVLALALASFSAFIMAILFGSSSPKIIERKVTIITMITVAIVVAYGFKNAIFSIVGIRYPLNLSAL